MRLRARWSSLVALHVWHHRGIGPNFGAAMVTPHASHAVSGRRGRGWYFRAAISRLSRRRCWT
jgi:hypothetical protein